MEKERLTIKWLTRKPATIARIRERFAIPSYTTLNGWSPAEIDPEDKPVLEECVARGFINILPLKWCKNGGL